VKTPEASGVVELEDKEVLQFIERSEAANTVGKKRSDQNKLYLS
jgi:hypothetical protein